MVLDIKVYISARAIDVLNHEKILERTLCIDNLGHFVIEFSKKKCVSVFCVEVEQNTIDLNSEDEKIILIHCTCKSMIGKLYGDMNYTQINDK